VGNLESVLEDVVLVSNSAWKTQICEGGRPRNCGVTCFCSLAFGDKKKKSRSFFNRQLQQATRNVVWVRRPPVELLC
jgi:hypothetical protein